MTFGPFRKALGTTVILSEYEMYRFCSKGNVIGGAGKMLKYFIKKYNPTRIISYADRRWSNKNDAFYTKIGFNLVSVTRPNYYYTSNYFAREYRFKYRKNNLSKLLQKYNPILSEWENMQLNGYDRIWDCGCLKFEFIPQIWATEFLSTNS